MMRLTEELMRSTIAFFATLLAALAVSPLRADPVNWAATSNTAMAITGDIVLDDYSLTFANGKSLDLEPHEAWETGQAPVKTCRAMSPRSIRPPIPSCSTATSSARCL
jgi:hypothetical protein